MMNDVMLVEGAAIEREVEAAVPDSALIPFPLSGRILVRGADRLDLLHRLSTNNLLTAKPGQIVSTVFTTDKGRIIDFVRVVVNEASLLLLASRGNEEKFVQWIEKFVIMEDVQLEVVSHSTEMVSFVGPMSDVRVRDAFSVSLQPDTSTRIAAPFGEVTFLVHKEFGTQFVDLIVRGNLASQLDDYLQSQTRAKLTEESYEAFRILQGIPRIHNELTDAYNPYEVGLAGAISFTKGCYIGQEVIARLDTYQKIQKTLWGIRCQPNVEMNPLVGSSVEFEGEAIGAVTSVSMPINGRLAALAVLKKNTVAADNHVSIVSGGNVIDGTIASLPMTIVPGTFSLGGQ